MRIQFISKASGAFLGIFEGKTVDDALDAFAQARGFLDFEHGTEMTGWSREDLVLESRPPVADEPLLDVVLRHVQDIGPVDIDGAGCVWARAVSRLDRGIELLGRAVDPITFRLVLDRYRYATSA